MGAPVEFTNEESAAIYQRLADGSSSRSVARWFQERYGKSVSHTTVLSVGKRMRAEQEETEAVFDAPDQSVLSDGDRLEVVLRTLRRLQARALTQRADRLGTTRVALRAVELEFRVLRFKLGLDGKKPRVEAPPLESPHDLSSFPEEAFTTKSPVNPAESDSFSELSNELSSEPSISIADDVPDASAQGRQQPAEYRLEWPPDDKATDRDRLKQLDARMREILASVSAVAAPSVTPPSAHVDERASAADGVVSSGRV